MKSYPKVPRYDHDSVESDFLEADDLRAFEKVDGSNFRFTLYDDRFNHSYGEDVSEIDPQDGDIVLGLAGTIRGKLSDPLASFDGNLQRAVRFLRERIDRDALREIHNEYGPVVWFAENMVLHSLDYDYTDSPPPPLIGFDAYAPQFDPRESIPGNPFEERFEGFLQVNDSKQAFEDIGLPFTHEYDLENLDLDGLLNLDEEAFPESVYADVTIEGVILRSDSRERRVKVVREEFQELNREAFGLNKHQAETGEEFIVAAYCTTGRIRKIIRKMVVDEGRDFGLHLNEDLYPRVYDDIWQENWHDIKHLDIEFNPSRVQPLIAERCIRELRRMKTNAELNDSPATELWRDF